MTIKNSNRGLRSAITVKKEKIASLKQPRFPREKPEAIAKLLRHLVKTNQIRWTPDLLRLVMNNAAKHWAATFRRPGEIKDPVDFSSLGGKRVL
jgi:hypothetical protein